MAHQKRKAQHGTDSHENETSRQYSPGLQGHKSVHKQLNKHNGEVSGHQPRDSQRTEEQLRCAPQLDSPNNDLASQQSQRELLPLQQDHSQSLRSTSECPSSENEQLDDEAQVVSIRPEPFTPYSDSTIPILWSTQINHSVALDPSLQYHEWSPATWKGYGEAIVLIKTGINRQSLGLPAASKEAGSLLTITCVDLYYNVLDKKIYVASETGLITVSDYIRLCNIDLSRKLRFTGTIPTWAKTLLGKEEKRYVTEPFEGEPLPVRSEVHVFATFDSPEEPAGPWGYMFSVAVRSALRFPMHYTAKKRPGILSAVEQKHILGLPDKQPSPQELGEALFRQAEDCDQGKLDLSMTKTRDEYLKDCGYLYGKFALANTQQKKDFFTGSFDPIDELDDSEIHGDIYPSSEHMSTVATNSRGSPSLSDSGVFTITNVDKGVQPKPEATRKHGDRTSTSIENPYNQNTPSPAMSITSGRSPVYMIPDGKMGTATGETPSAKFEIAEGPGDKAQQKRTMTLDNSPISIEIDKPTPILKDDGTGVLPTRKPDTKKQSSLSSSASPRKRGCPFSPPPSTKRAKKNTTAEYKDQRDTFPLDQNRREDACEAGNSTHDDRATDLSAKHDRSPNVRAQEDNPTNGIIDRELELALAPYPSLNETDALGNPVPVRRLASSAEFCQTIPADMDECDIEIPTYEELIEEMRRRGKR